MESPLPVGNLAPSSPNNLFQSVRLGQDIKGNVSVRPFDTNVVVLMAFSSLGIFSGVTFTGVGLSQKRPQNF